MMRVAPAPEPPDFDHKVRQPGLRALRELIGDPNAPKRTGPKRKPVASRFEDIPVGALEKAAFWTEALGDLRRSYKNLCAYLGMKIHWGTGAATVDHFLPKSKHQRLAYEWSNFRLSCATVNLFKDQEENILDSFEIVDGDFVLDVANFEVGAAEHLSEDQRERVQETIKVLKLNEPTFTQARREYHDRYHGLVFDDERGARVEPWPLSWLESECPYVARELRRQGRLRPEDQAQTGGGPS